MDLRHSQTVEKGYTRQKHFPNFYSFKLITKLALCVDLNSSGETIQNFRFVVVKTLNTFFIFSQGLSYKFCEETKNVARENS